VTVASLRGVVRALALGREDRDDRRGHEDAAEEVEGRDAGEPAGRVARAGNLATAANRAGRMARIATAPDASERSLPVRPPRRRCAA